MLRVKKYRKFNWIVQSVLIIAVIIAVVFSVLVSQDSFDKNVANRALSELISTSEMQAEVSDYIMSEQYLPLKVIANAMEKGVEFDDDEIKPMLESTAKVNRLCMLGFADLNGDVINYKGETGGNISDREYFRDIVDGVSEEKCEYLFTTKILNEPRVIFSIPVYREGKLIGVLFESKEITVLEQVLFNNNLFNGSECMFICDADYNVLVANECAEDIMIKHPGDELASAFKNSDIYSIVKQERNENQTSGVINIAEKQYYMAYTSLGINDWTLFCKTDYDNAKQAYDSNLNVMRNLVLKVVLIFSVVVLLVIAMMAAQIIQRIKEEKILMHYYDNYNILLKEMNCALIEYDIANNTLYSNKAFFEMYGINQFNGSMDEFEKFKELHPEFDFTELDKEILLARENRRTYSFETIVELKDNQIRWLKIILVPISDADGLVNKIMVIVSDTTDIHSEFDKATDTLEKIPSGLHRCYLSDPIHLEYFSDGLCKMLGYTREEFYEKVDGNKYSNVIYEEDKKIFRDFIRELAEKEGTNSCEYRMVCKDGSLISVSDIMDAKRSASGIMYGYSVVIDLTKYQEAQQEAERELREMREQLEQTRLKVSASQMQPHFLYNALASIRELVLEEPQYASDLIYDFTTHLRACIKAMASDQLVPFRQETENIKAYVNIEKMRFGDKLNIVYDYDLEECNFEIIPLSIQPLVENAIRHGIHERGAKGGTVWIRSYRFGESYFVEVEDNGVGFDVESVMKDITDGKKDSTGLVNLIYRFEKLMNAKVMVKSDIGVGTKVTVQIAAGE